MGDMSRYEIWLKEFRDFESQELNRLRVPKVARQLGSVVEAHVEVRGLCERCQRQGSAAKSRLPRAVREH